MNEKLKLNYIEPSGMTVNQVNHDPFSDKEKFTFIMNGLNVNRTYIDENKCDDELEYIDEGRFKDELENKDELNLPTNN
ncbi:hypothetical protein C1645_838502 [Glomus cerebriforme]|uniref:Uncharacterized protein n=1 Tax=Glomus cerebriforme TaxID=658196 RepID=A0A397S724_9GLOM|nr:hypothetical protein C1645_838502 [Glomus cerebriforme]